MAKQLVETMGQKAIMIHSLLLEQLALLASSLSPAPFPSFLAERTRQLLAASRKNTCTFLNTFLNQNTFIVRKVAKGLFDGGNFRRRGYVVGHRTGGDGVYGGNKLKPDTTCLCNNRPLMLSYLKSRDNLEKCNPKEELNICVETLILCPVPRQHNYTKFPSLTQEFRQCSLPNMTFWRQQRVILNIIREEVGKLHTKPCLMCF